MKSKVKVLLLIILLINLSACNNVTEKNEQSKEIESTSAISTSVENESSTSESIVKDTSSFTSESEIQSSSEIKNIVNLGTIYYQNLDVNDPIQANAQFLGCYIVDDGETVNFIPLMAATVQNLHIYTSGQGNEDYYKLFQDKAIETSHLTGGKPVSIFDREDGDLIITAQNGKITFSK